VSRRGRNDVGDVSVTVDRVVVADRLVERSHHVREVAVHLQQVSFEVGLQIDTLADGHSLVVVEDRRAEDDLRLDDHRAVIVALDLDRLHRARAPTSDAVDAAFLRPDANDAIDVLSELHEVRRSIRIRFDVDVGDDDRRRIGCRVAILDDVLGRDRPAGEDVEVEADGRDGVVLLRDLLLGLCLEFVEGPLVGELAFVDGVEPPYRERSVMFSAAHFISPLLKIIFNALHPRIR
jgi:hypothetical protein